MKSCSLRLLFTFFLLLVTSSTAHLLHPRVLPSSQTASLTSTLSSSSSSSPSFTISHSHSLHSQRRHGIGSSSVLIESAAHATSRPHAEIELTEPLHSHTPSQSSSSSPTPHDLITSSDDIDLTLLSVMERSRTSSPYLHEVVATQQQRAREQAATDVDADMIDADLITRVEGKHTAEELRKILETYVQHSKHSPLVHEDITLLEDGPKQLEEQRKMRAEHMKKVLEEKYKKMHHTQQKMRSDTDSESDASSTSASASNKVSTISNHTVLKSSEDDRSYRFLTLTNGLRVVLVSDPNTTKSAAAMDVGNGYLSDPTDIPGLAHFLEHMLFLGTEKYPSESEYADFIESHGGFSNAYTAMETTNFYFDVLPGHLKGALDRFAQFFISPTLSVNTTSREMRAVDSEHSKNILSDSWRTNRLVQVLANTSHPYSKFGTGCARTLDARPHSEMVDELKKFWSKYYIAPNLILAVIGTETLEQLTEMVDELFADVPKGDGMLYDPLVNTTRAHVFNSSILGSEIYVNTIEDSKFVSLIFPLPSQLHHYQHQSIGYIKHFIESRSTGSLIQEYKQRGYGTQVSLSIDASTTQFATLQFSIELTNQGVEHVDELIATFFSYLHLLEKHGVEQWRYEELQKISNLTYTYKDKEHPSDFISHLSSSRRHYSPEHLLVGGKLFLQYDEKHIRSILSELTPQNMLILLGGKSLNHQMNYIEEWYGIEYDLLKVADKRMKYWRDSVKNTKKHYSFKLPEKSKFLPTKPVSVLSPLLNPVPHPIILYETNKTAHSGDKNEGVRRVWYSEDLEFHRPHAYVIFRFYLPKLSQGGEEAYLLTNIYFALLEDSIDELFYSAFLTGFNTHFRVGTCYVDMIVNGYSTGLAEYLKSVVKMMSMRRGKDKKGNIRYIDEKHRFQPDERRFNIYKESLYQSYLNKKYEAPHRQSSQLLSALLDPHHSSSYDLLAVLQRLTLHDVNNWSANLMQDMSVECYIHGNIYPDDAVKMMNDVFVKYIPYMTDSSSFLSVSTRNHLIPRPRLGQVREDVSVTMKASNPLETNSAIIKYWQYGMGGLESKLYTQLLSLIVQKPIFHHLRTVEQLGYIVWSNVENKLDVSGFKVQVQSGRYSSEYLEKRIDSFILTSLRQTLLNLSQKDFEVYIETLMMSKLQSPISMSVQHSWFWNEISRQEYVFQRKEIELYLLNATAIISHQGFKEFVTKLFYISDPENPGMESCEVHGGGVMNVMIQAAAKVAAQNTTSTKNKKKKSSPLDKAPIDPENIDVPSERERSIAKGDAIVKKVKDAASGTDTKPSGPVDSSSPAGVGEKKKKIPNEPKVPEGKQSMELKDKEDDGVELKATQQQQQQQPSTKSLLSVESDSESESDSSSDSSSSSTSDTVTEILNAAEAEIDARAEEHSKHAAELDHESENEHEVESDSEETEFLEDSEGVDDYIYDEEEQHPQWLSEFLELDLTLEHEPSAHAMTSPPADSEQNSLHPHSAETQVHNMHASSLSHHSYHKPIIGLFSTVQPERRKLISGGPFARCTRRHSRARSLARSSLDQPISILTRARDGSHYQLNTSQASLQIYTDSLMLYPRNRYETPPEVTLWKNEKPKEEDQTESDAATTKEEEE